MLIVADRPEIDPTVFPQAGTVSQEALLNEQHAALLAHALGGGRRHQGDAGKICTVRSNSPVDLGSSACSHSPSAITVPLKLYREPMSGMFVACYMPITWLM